MIAKVNKAMKVQAEKILEGDFSKSGFFLNIDDSFESETVKRTALIERSKMFLEGLKNGR